MICISNQKGGAGKTTFSALVSYSLADKGRVLTIDADPQGGLTALFNAPPGPGLFDLLIGNTADPVNIKQNIDLIRGEHRLDQIAFTMGPYDIENIIKRFIDYDFIVIDTPPTVQGITRAAAIPAHTLLVPADIAKTTIGPTLYTLDALKALKKAPRVVLIGKEGGTEYNRGLYQEFLKAIKADYLFTLPRTVSAQKAAAGECNISKKIQAMIQGAII